MHHYFKYMSTAIEYDGFALSRKIYPKLEKSDHLRRLAEQEQPTTITLADLARRITQTQTWCHLDKGLGIEPMRRRNSP